MDIMPLGDTSIAIFIDSEDLDGAGITSQNLDLDAASPIVTTALIEAGMMVDGSLEIEAYTNSEGVLVFARIIPSFPVFCSFDKLDNLLEAACQVGNPPPGTRLTYLDGIYFLTLNGAARELKSMLCEFGDIDEFPPDFDLYLKEHGSCLIQYNALGKLSEYFA